MANGHGGARPGAGRKPTRQRFPRQVSAAEKAIAAALAEVTAALIHRATVGQPAGERVEERYEAAGAVLVDDVARDPETGDVLTDARGNPVRIKRGAFPDKDPGELVLVERRVIEIPETGTDRQAGEYLLNRILGTPTAVIDAEVAGPGGAAIPVAVMDAVRKAYADAEEPAGGE